MNIAIDARWIFPKISGIGAYTRSLIRALHQLDHSHYFTLYFDNANVAKDVTALTDIGNDQRFRTALPPIAEERLNISTLSPSMPTSIRTIRISRKAGRISFNLERTGL